VVIAFEEAIAGDCDHKIPLSGFKRGRFKETCEFFYYCGLFVDDYMLIDFHIPFVYWDTMLDE
jgi:hypothetical protein